MKIKYSLLFILAVLCFSCEEEQEDFSVDQKASFTAEIDGRTVSMIESDSLIADSTFIFCDTGRGRSFGNQDYVIETWRMMFGALFHEDFTIKNVITVQFVNHFAESRYNQEDILSRSLFEQVLSTGNKKYTSNDEDVPGVIVEWYDQHGVKWTTNNPRGIDDTDNYFKINRSIHQNTLYNNIYTNGLSDSIAHIQYLDVSFGCKLYNDNGQGILLKNGKMKYNLVLYKFLY